MNVALATPPTETEAQPLPDETPKAARQPDVTVEMVSDILPLLRPDQLAEVWKFIQFLDYKDFLEDPTEDEWAWRMVQENEKYKELHPDEPMEVFASGEEFLKATENW